MAKIINLDDPSQGGQPNWLHQHRLDKERKAKMKFDKKYYEYLDELRESGITNMFGARPFLRSKFRELSEPLATKVLGDWMKTFSKRHPRKQEASNGQKRD